MNNYIASVSNKYDLSKFLVDSHIKVDMHEKYENACRALEMFANTDKVWDYDHISLLYEQTNEEAAMEQLDEYIVSQIQISTKKGPTLVKVVFRQRDLSGTLIGTKKDNKTLDTRIYNVKYEDEHYKKYSSNILAEELAKYFDSDRYDTGSIMEICGYCSSNKAIPRSQAFFLIKERQSLAYSNHYRLGSLCQI